MELLKKNIHMDRVKAEGVTQITLEDDLNVPESKPDISAICFEKGCVVLEEVSAGTDHVNVSGYLSFRVLYSTAEEGCTLAALEGKIPFAEKINISGTVSSDDVAAEGQLEDLSVSTINSRKLNIQSVVTLECRVSDLYDVQIPIGVRSEEPVEYRREPLMLTQIAVDKKDIFRMKEEMTLPSGYPNIAQILWSSVTPEEMDFRVMDEKLGITGELHVFVLYEGDDHTIHSYEQHVPVAGALECYGCKEGMIPDIEWKMADYGQQAVTVRPDYDGEERSIGLEPVFDIRLKLYEEDNMEMVTDLYSVSRHVETQVKECGLQSLFSRVGGKTKVTEKVKAGGGRGILQLLHSDSQMAIENLEPVEKGIEIKGHLLLHVLYITGEDAEPYKALKTQIPYRYVLEVKDMSPLDVGQMKGEVDQLQVTLLDGEEMDVKAVLSFSTVMFRNVPLEVIDKADIMEPDAAEMGKLPGMAVYVVKTGDNLWNIGKKYYVPVDVLRSINGLENDELLPGQKLLVVKGC